MHRVELGEIQLWIWQQGGGLPTELPTKYYKQWGTKSDHLKVQYHEGCAWLKGAQVVKWGGIPGVTPWFEDPLGHKKNR